MPLFSRKKLSFHGLASQSTKQPPPVCTWSAHTPQSGPSPLQFPRSSHTLTATADGELFLFGGYVHGHESTLPSRDLYAFSTRDFSATLLQTSGKVPTRRVSHGAALIGTTLLICGGKTNFLNQNALSQRQNDSLYRLNLGASDLLMLRPTPADQSLCSRISRVDSRRGQWTRTWRSLLSHRDDDPFQALRLRRSDGWEVTQ
jgi:hypothetical protein